MNLSPWLLVFLLLVLILLLAWWLALSSRRSIPPDIKAQTPVHAYPAPGVADDLVIIEGIGPRVAQLLEAEGIKTFAQLADTQPARLREILRNSGFQMMDPDSWPEQARLAAAGDQAGLDALQDRLKAGR